MGRDVIIRDRPAAAALHPLVYAAMAGLALWLILSVWSFAGNGDVDFALVAVSGLVLVAVTIPFVIWRTWRRRADRDRDQPATPLREWAAGEFDTWQGRLKGAHAAAEILLPIAAVAFGMTIFGIVFHLATHGRVAMATR